MSLWMSAEACSMMKYVSLTAINAKYLISLFGCLHQEKAAQRNLFNAFFVALAPLAHKAFRTLNKEKISTSCFKPYT